MATQTTVAQIPTRSTAQPVALHWRECAVDGLCLGLFMVSVCLFGSLFEHPGSPVRQGLPDGTFRRALMALAMGLTAMALIYSRLGQRSGAHMNPATTLTFLRLGKIGVADAGGYIVAQLVGGILGVQAVALGLRHVLGDPAVNFVVTSVGPSGVTVALLAEAAISCLLMLTVLVVSNRPQVARYTGACAGLLIMAFIVVEAPLSGMSMNPARSLASAMAAGLWSDLWIYFVGPPAGMLLAGELYHWVAGRHTVRCAKLHHPATGGCHFNCDVPGQRGGAAR